MRGAEGTCPTRRSTLRKRSRSIARGHVGVVDGPERVLVPVDTLLSLVARGGDDALREVATALGRPIGAHVAARLPGIGEASLEAVVEHLGGELAVVGLGALGAERWGTALALVVDHALAGDTAEALTGAVLETALQTATGRDARCVRVSREGDRVRWLIVGPVAAERVAAWQRAGAAWGEIVVRLHAPRGGAA